jgi:hypothetical protein
MKYRCFLSFVFMIFWLYVSADSIYVSAFLGKDNNSGLSEEYPLKSISLALEKSDIVLLRAGDVFYCNLSFHGKKLLRYGEGENPTLCGLRSIIKPKWEYVDSNIWKIDLTEKNYFGYKCVGASLDNNIGCLYEVDKDLIHGKKVKYYKDLSTDWDIWQTESFSGDVSPDDFSYLYLYLSSDPNCLNLQISSGAIGITASNSTIEGINVVGFGFGISAGSNMIIKNCKIDIIGGKILLGYHRFVLYGNGIEFNLSYSERSNCIVESCMVSRTYDSGMTIQMSKSNDVAPRNIIFRNNLFLNCCQAWEDYLMNPEEHIRYYDCIFENNIVINSGNSGFGYPKNKVNYCHVLGYNNKGNKGMIIRNNTFVGGNFYCSVSFDNSYKSNIWEGNKCYIKRGNYLVCNHDGTKDVIAIPLSSTLNKNRKTEISKYRELTGDKSTRFYIKTQSWINNKAEKLIKTYLKTNGF